MFHTPIFSVVESAKEKPFKMTIDTTKAGSASDTFVLPLVNGAAYNFVVDWGDQV